MHPLWHARSASGSLVSGGGPSLQVLCIADVPSTSQRGAAQNETPGCEGKPACKRARCKLTGHTESFFCIKSLQCLANGLGRRKPAAAAAARRWGARRARLHACVQAAHPAPLHQCSPCPAASQGWLRNGPHLPRTAAGQQASSSTAPEPAAPLIIMEKPLSCLPPELIAMLASHVAQPADLCALLRCSRELLAFKDDAWLQVGHGARPAPPRLPACLPALQGGPWHAAHGTRACLHACMHARTHVPAAARAAGRRREQHALVRSTQRAQRLQRASCSLARGAQALWMARTHPADAPLRVVAMEGKEPVLLRMLRLPGVQASSCTDAEGWHLLHLAGAAGWAEVCLHLITVLRVDPNVKGPWRHTPLMRAAKNGHVGVVQVCCPCAGGERPKG